MSTKGSGFAAPSKPHEGLHIEVTCISIDGTFYYLYAVLDGDSRYIDHSR